MKTAEKLSYAASTAVIKTHVKMSQELENAGSGVGMNSEDRSVCRIAFEEYLSMWMKIATTKPELLIRRDSLDELIIYPERFAAYYGSNERYDLIQPQRKVFKVIKDSPVQMVVQVLSKRDTKRTCTRVEQMRKIYMQHQAPELLTPQIPGSAPCPELEHWEREMDELVAWTHSLSLKELDDL